MRTSKMPNLFIVIGLFLTFVSCGEDNKKTRAAEPSCSEISCLSAVNWKILLQGRNFPAKSRVDINGATVINECVSKQKFSIDRTTEPQSIILENYYVPVQGDLKIDVVDLGHCDSESTFVSDDKVNFEVTKGLSGTEIQINL